MLKKLLIASAIAVVSVNVAFAYAAPYVGAGLGVQTAGGYNGAMANVFAGYGSTMGPCNNYYLGGEVFADVGSVPLSHNYFRRTSAGLGASILPGVYLNPCTMAYARVGVEAMRYSHSNATRTGGQIGLGLQTSLNKNWDVRGEYDYTGMGIVRDFTKVSNNRFNVGLVYKIY